FKVDKRRSRPYVENNRFSTTIEFKEAWDALLGGIDRSTSSIVGLPPQDVDKVLYAATHAFACAFEVIGTGSRGSNGKLFEYATALILRDLLGAEVGGAPK